MPSSKQGSESCYNTPAGQQQQLQQKQPAAVQANTVSEPADAAAAAVPVAVDGPVLVLVPAAAAVVPAAADGPVLVLVPAAVAAAAERGIAVAQPAAEDAPAIISMSTFRQTGIQVLKVRPGKIFMGCRSSL